MKKSNIGIGLASMLVLGLTTGYAAAQGSLAPSGAPSPTMKTLEQVEARTPISSLPYTITNSGSYYVTGNLGSSGHGLIISTSDVTVDLMGFTLNGDRGNVDFGIYITGATDAALSRICIQNGTVRDFGSGIRALYANDSRFEKLIVGHNYARGIYLHGSCNGNRIVGCMVEGNHGGVTFDGGHQGACNRNSIVNCSIGGNGTRGIHLYGGYFGECNGNRITGCSISGNGDCGVDLDGRSSGACSGNRLLNCTLRGNTYCGIRLNEADANWIEGNHVSGTSGATTGGIWTENCQDNLVVCNSCEGHTDNFNLDADDTYGPEISAAGVIGSTNPWANFSF